MFRCGASIRIEFAWTNEFLTINFCLIQVEHQSGYVFQSERRTSYGLLASLRCLWTRAGNSVIYGPYERPPFPIKIDAPTWGDLAREVQLSDFVMGGTVYSFGLLWGYYASRPYPMVMQRLVIYHGVSHMFFALGVSMMIAVPFRRLTGYWDNGLRWKSPEDKLNKFDCTSHFEANTIWKRFRIRSEE